MKTKVPHWTCCLGIAALIVSTASLAQVTEIKIARGFGLTTLPLRIVENKQLVEKHAKRLGMPGLKVTFNTIGDGPGLNDALLSGAVNIMFSGVGPFVLLWSRTAGSNNEVRSFGSISSMPLYLNTRNPAVRTIADFTEQDRIALPSPKTSGQAILLQMAAAKMFGEQNSSRLDAWTVGMPHPEATRALLSGVGITAHFGSPPYQYQQLKAPGIRKVLSSFDVLDGPSSFTMGVATVRFQQENPKALEAVTSAIEEAIAFIKVDKKAAAEIYLQETKEKTPVEEILAMLNDPEIQFTMTPSKLVVLANFMNKVGLIKTSPKSWRDFFFESVHRLPGS